MKFKTYLEHVELHSFHIGLESIVQHVDAFHRVSVLSVRMYNVQVYAE